MAKAGRHISRWQRYFIIVQLKYTRGQRHRLSIVLMHSISGPMKCISPCTLSPRVKLQLYPLKFIPSALLNVFFQQKQHVPSHIMFARRCNFIKSPREFNLSLVSHFWPCRSAIRILVCALVKFQQLLPTCCPDPKSSSSQLCSKFPQMCACSTDSIKHAAELSFVDSGQLATPREIETFVRNGQKYVLSKCSKCVLWNFTRAHLRTA